jgi:hypothetical protein
LDGWKPGEISRAFLRCEILQLLVVLVGILLRHRAGIQVWTWLKPGVDGGFIVRFGGAGSSP